MLREARAEKSGRPLIDSEAATAIFGDRYGRLPWAPEHVASAIRRLRAKGYRIANYHGGYYRLIGEPSECREASNARPGNARRAPTGGADGLALPSSDAGTAGRRRMVVMDDALIEEIARAIYRDVWASGRPDLPPYGGASEQTAARARAIARGALTGIEAAGYRLVRDAGVRSYPAT